MKDQILSDEPSQIVQPSQLVEVGSKPFDYRWLSLMLFIITSSAILAGVETESYYHRILRLQMSGASTFDVVLIFWSLWAKTLVVLLPMIVLGAVLFWYGWKQFSISLLLFSSTAFFIWLIVDIRLQRFTGGHISSYIENIFNPDTWGWSGDLTTIYWKMAWDLIATVTGAIVLYQFFKRLMKSVAKRYPSFPRQWHLTGASCVVFAIILGLIPALQFVNESLALERLYAALPTNALFFKPENVPSGGTAAFTVHTNDEFSDLGHVIHQISMKPASIDQTAFIPRSNRPNVVLFIVESLRSNTISKKTMPRLTAFANQGTVLKQHFSASNKSDLGTFGLLYGRSPLTYDVTLDQKIPQQACVIFKNSGYQTSLIGSCSFHQGKMNLFMDDQQFDSTQIYQDPKMTWWKRDRNNLKQVKHILSQKQKQPQFVVSYLMSTHFSYDYPTEYEINCTEYQPAKNTDHLKDAYALNPKDLSNRYTNSLAFMDDELGQLVESIDLKKNIVIITGDHGESFFEDGHATHGTTLSDVQTHVPMIIAGVGVPKQSMTVPTSHIDLLSSLVHLMSGEEQKIANSHGSSFFSKNYHPQALVVHQNSDTWDVMFIRPDGRLKMNLQRSHPAIRLIGFTNNIGHASRNLSHPPREIPLWRRNLATALKNYRITSQKHQTAQTDKQGHKVQ